MGIACQVVSDGDAKGCALGINGPKTDSTKKLHCTAIDIAVHDGVIKAIDTLSHYVSRLRDF